MTEPTDSKTDKIKSEKSASPKKKSSIKGNSFIGLLLSPGYWPVAAYELCVAWFFTRKWLRLLTMLPFVAGIGFLLFASIRGNRMNSLEIAARYVSWTEEAEKERNAKEEEKKEGNSIDNSSLDIYYRRLLNTPLQEATRFKIASFLAATGKMEQARSQMQILAPEDKAGFGPAHLWMVRAMMNTKDLAVINSPSFRHHIERALELLPEDPVALWLASQLKFKLGQKQEGLELLERASKKDPHNYLETAQRHRQFGNEDSFQINLERATSFFRERFSKDAKDVKYRFGLIQCLLLSNSTDEVIQIAEEGLRVQSSEEMRKLVVQCYIQVFDRLSGSDKTGDRGIRALERCLQLEPQNAAALERIANLVATRPDVDWKELKQKLEDTLADGSAPATVHVLLADGLLQRGEDDLAKVHLEQALSQRPDMLAVLNNLAWISAFKEPSNLDRAESLIEQAIQIAPQHPEVRETRGAIFLKQKKYSQAIAMLEPLLKVFPKRKELRLWIAEAYTELGDSSMAERYRKLAEEIVPASK